LVASSWSTSRCSESLPSPKRTTSAAIHDLGRQWPEERLWAMT
jgi:hypothetical protein